MDAMSDEIFNRKLINMVSGKPLLYNPFHPDKKSKQKQESSWREIATDLNVDVQFCQARWSNLRSTYCRKHKKNASSMDSSGPVVEHWPYFAQMSFLNGYVKHRGSAEMFLQKTEHYGRSVEDVSGIEFCAVSDSHSSENVPSEHEDCLVEAFLIEKDEFVDPVSNKKRKIDSGQQENQENQLELKVHSQELQVNQPELKVNHLELKENHQELQVNQPEVKINQPELKINHQELKVNHQELKNEFFEFLQKHKDDLTNVDKKPDRYDSFGSFVACELRAKGSGISRVYMRKICEVLFSDFTVGNEIK